MQQGLIWKESIYAILVELFITINYTVVSSASRTDITLEEFPLTRSKAPGQVSDLDLWERPKKKVGGLGCNLSSFCLTSAEKKGAGMSHPKICVCPLSRSRFCPALFEWLAMGLTRLCQSVFIPKPKRQHYTTTNPASCSSIYTIHTAQLLIFTPSFNLKVLVSTCPAASTYKMLLNLTVRSMWMSEWESKNYLHLRFKYL